MTTAALFFDPDGYILTGPKLMGRQAAGHGFLKAATLAHGGETLWVYAANKDSAKVFFQLASSFDPKAKAKWIPLDQIEQLAQVGTLFYPGPGLGDPARLRLRLSPAAYSLVGITHTLASHIAMDSIADLVDAPLMPWDALICTSSAGGACVKNLLEAHFDYLRWRFGTPLHLAMPQLPVIPLGVHSQDFDFSEEERAAARQTLHLAADETVVLFVGRLSFHAKAHPHPMYLGLQAAAERTGRRITLIQSGSFANEFIGEAFKDAARRFCPDIRAIFSDGKDFTAHRRCWAAADVFISLSDNIQETFGLTPIEAMAAGLPVVVTDWDGYKDTVRDGIDGFRIPTWMPPPDLGAHYARAYEAGTDNYDFYCGLNCQTVSVDLAVLTDRLSTLINHPELRRQLGHSARQRARSQYDWAVVYRQYQALWADLSRIRLEAPKHEPWRSLIEQAPRMAPTRQDPYRTFMHYPTHLLHASTQVRRLPERPTGRYPELLAHGLYNYAGKILPRPEVAEHLLNLCADQTRPLAELAHQAGYEVGETALALAVLAKMGLIRLEPPENTP